MRVIPKRIYIAIEGPDGVGKTTQIELLKKKFEEHNVPTFVIKEPHPDSPITSVIRNEFLSGKRKCSDIMMQSLMAAAREDMINNIFPSFGSKLMNQENIPPVYVILSDRCVLSAYMYTVKFVNAMGNDTFIDTNFIDLLHDHFLNYAVLPDMIITLIASDVNKLISRISERNDNNTYDEKSRLEIVTTNYNSFCFKFNSANCPSKLLGQLHMLNIPICISKAISPNDIRYYTSSELHQKIIKSISDKYLPDIDLFDEYDKNKEE